MSKYSISNLSKYQLSELYTHFKVKKKISYPVMEKVEDVGKIKWFTLKESPSFLCFIYF